MEYRISKLKNYVFVGIINLVFIVSFVNVSSVSAETKNKDKYEVAYEEAMKLVEALNTDNLDINIGNSFNVVDTEGELTGYSFGYFVGKKPYGYAIYSLVTDSIKIFEFNEGVENLYLELEDKAGETENVNEDSMINCLVEEGGLDYATFDTKGNRVGNFEDERGRKGVKYDKSAILQSNTINYSKSSKYPFYHDTNVKHKNELPSGGSFNCIPDFGLSMINYDYIQKHSAERGYNCDVASATGTIGYLGYLKNGSYIDTYNDIFDMCFTRDEWGEIMMVL